jgi:hypothetical protein
MKTGKIGNGGGRTARAASKGFTASLPTLNTVLSVASLGLSALVLGTFIFLTVVNVYQGDTITNNTFVIESNSSLTQIVTSFNNRTGAVVSNYGDYVSTDIPFENVTVDISLRSKFLMATKTSNVPNGIPLVSESDLLILTNNGTELQISFKDNGLEGTYTNPILELDSSGFIIMIGSGPSAVLYVFGRTGPNITAMYGDYNSMQIAHNGSSVYNALNAYYLTLYDSPDLLNDIPLQVVAGELTFANATLGLPTLLTPGWYYNVKDTLYDENGRATMVVISNATYVNSFENRTGNVFIMPGDVDSVDVTHMYSTVYNTLTLNRWMVATHSPLTPNDVVTSFDPIYYTMTDNGANITITPTLRALTPGTITNLATITIAPDGAVTSAFSGIQPGTPFGCATLNGIGQLESTQIPSSLLNGLKFIDMWNAATNTPFLINGTGVCTPGNFYIVNVAGNTTLNNFTNWQVGQFLVCNNSTRWALFMISNGFVVDRFNGRYGDVVPVFGDYTSNMIPYTNGSGFSVYDVFQSPIVTWGSSPLLTNPMQLSAVMGELTLSGATFGLADQFVSNVSVTYPSLIVFNKKGQFSYGISYQPILTVFGRGGPNITAMIGDYNSGQILHESSTVKTALEYPIVVLGPSPDLINSAILGGTPGELILSGATFSLAPAAAPGIYSRVRDLVIINGGRVSALTVSNLTEVYSFNNRTGNVVPLFNDYQANLIGWQNTSVAAALGTARVMLATESYLYPSGVVTVFDPTIFTTVDGGSTLTVSLLQVPGAPNGLATLDAAGQVTMSQIPSYLFGGLRLVGLWNARNNTPTLFNGTGACSTGQFYMVEVAGNTTLNGHSNWLVGMWAVCDNTTKWDQFNFDTTNFLEPFIMYAPPSSMLQNARQLIIFGRTGYNFTAQIGDYTSLQISHLNSSVFAGFMEPYLTWAPADNLTPLARQFVLFNRTGFNFSSQYGDYSSQQISHLGSSVFSGFMEPYLTYGVPDSLTPLARQLFIFNRPGSNFTAQLGDYTSLTVTHNGAQLKSSLDSFFVVTTFNPLLNNSVVLNGVSGEITVVNATVGLPNVFAGGSYDGGFIFDTKGRAIGFYNISRLATLNGLSGNVSIIGTQFQATITVLGQTITISLPQNIHTTATPVFSSMTLGNGTIVLGTTFITAPTPTAPRLLTIPDVGSNASFVMDRGNQSISDLKIFTSTVTISAPTNQLILGSGTTYTVNAPTPASSRIISYVDPLADANYILSEGARTMNGITTLGARLNINSNSGLRLNNAANTAGTTLRAGTSLASNTAINFPTTNATVGAVLTAINIAGDTAWISPTANTDTYLFVQITTLIRAPAAGTFVTMLGYGNGTSTTTIAANTLVLGSTFSFMSRGIFTSGAANTVNLRVTVGGTVGATTSNGFGTQTNQGYTVSGWCTVRSIGVSGTMICFINGFFVATSFQSTGVATFTINTTIANIVDVQLQFATAGNSFTSGVSTINIKY